MPCDMAMDLEWLATQGWDATEIAELAIEIARARGRAKSSWAGYSDALRSQKADEAEQAVRREAHDRHHRREGDKLLEDLNKKAEELPMHVKARR